ncbi:MAG: hypothetical protein ACREOO_05750 [bacterium]
MTLFNSFRSITGACATILMSFASVEAQVVSEIELARLDSFMIAEDYPYIVTFFEFREQEIKKQKFKKHEIEGFASIQSSYLNTVRNLTAVHDVPADRMALLLERFTKFPMDYSEEGSGPQAARYYERFLLLLQNNEKSEGLKNYYLAAHFSGRHRRSVSSWITAALAETRHKYEQRYYEEALALIRQIELRAQALYLPHQERVQIKFLKEKIEKSLAKMHWEKEHYGRTDLPQRSWAAFVGAGFAHNLGIEDVTWRIRPVTPFYQEQLMSYDFVFDVSRKWTAGLAFDVGRALTKKLQMNVHLSHFTYSYKADRTNKQRGIDYLDYKVRQSIAHLELNYYLQARVGTRPFVGLGVGLARASRDAIDEPSGIFFLNIPERTKGERVNTPLLMTGIGLDYIPRADSRFLYKFFMGANYNFEKSQLLSRVNFVSSVKIGVGF